jgi:hypothetical protein
MFYAENSLIFWRNIAWGHGLVDTMLEQYSIGEVMSRTVEFSEIGSRPLVKVYSAKRLRRMFGDSRASQCRNARWFQARCRGCCGAFRRGGSPASPGGT